MTNINKTNLEKEYLEIKVKYLINTHNIQHIMKIYKYTLNKDYCYTKIDHMTFTIKNNNNNNNNNGMEVIINIYFNYIKLIFYSGDFSNFSNNLNASDTFYQILNYLE